MKNALKTLSIALTLIVTSDLSFASVVGVSSRVALLQQLQFGLEIKLKDYDLPAYLTSKLPSGTQPELITSTFLSAWTQLTYMVCQQAIAKSQVPTNLTTPDAIKKWLTKIASKSWTKQSQQSEIGAAYEAGFNSVNSTLPQTSRLALSCSFILSSPNFYAITTN
ncbi:MAG: hypothetical protein NTV34_02750 [Proteobacteria bacterium]|nr:hypothetical protein [Pseudomonadota bacterium]